MHLNDEFCIENDEFNTIAQDDTPDSMHYNQADDVDLTEVQLLDFSPETYVNFEAEVRKL